jgi:head-tail adaptor
LLQTLHLDVEEVEEKPFSSSSSEMSENTVDESVKMTSKDEDISEVEEMKSVGVNTSFEEESV